LPERLKGIDEETAGYNWTVESIFRLRSLLGFYFKVGGIWLDLPEDGGSEGLSDREWRLKGDKW